MDINKLGIYACVVGTMILFSCTSNKSEAPTVPQETYDALQQKYDMLKESVEGTLSANEEARVELNGIMVELNSITGRTISLHRNIENGTDMDTRTTAERISESIREIKKRLNAVSEKKVDKQQVALIENLRQTIALNEQEISRLNGIIDDKNQQISTLDNELANTNEQLRQTYEEMKRAEIQSWLSMGDELINTADLLPDVKGHGNMKPIKSAKLTILLRARSAYKQAYELGSAEALSKIRVAEDKYQSALIDNIKVMAILNQNQGIGSYEVKRLIKENNYCETYRVEDEKGEPFFLKLYILKNTPEKMLDSEHKVTCIEVMSKLRHKNIISYVEQGTYQNEEVGECAYVVTNYFSGELLADKLQREGPLPIDEALRIMKDVLEGLKFMHERSFFHNDITPRNIMLSEKTGGVAELIDLSHVSKYVGGSPSFDTSDLDERYQSNTTFVGMYNNATDLFSAIALFYTMLTNRVPWDVTIPEGTERKERIKMVKEARKTALNFDDVTEDEGFRRILTKGLCANGTCKYADVDILLDDLQNPSKVEEQKQPEQPLQQRPEQNNASEEEKQATSANVDVQKGKGNGFKDIAGMDQLKQMLTQKVIFILKDKEKAAKYKLLPPNGMLFYGPPGCGKSFFAEKFAEETGFNFMLVKASDLGSIYVHGSQGKIADLFKKAEETKPTIICFDEFDAFVPNRSNKGAEHQAGEVNEFLSQLNNCAQRGIFVIATSNRPDMIDPAVLRTGRIDKLVYVPMPDKDARREMFKIHLDGRPCGDLDMEHLAELTDGYIASDIAYIVNDAAMGAAFSDKPITQQLLEETISSIHPSLSKEVVNNYENLRQKMEDTDARNRRPKIGFIK